MAAVSVVVLATIAWGSLAFGAVYPWAYWPLFAAAAVAGATGLAMGRATFGGVPHKHLVFALTILGVAVWLQVQPFPARVVTRVSPATDALLRRYDFGYVSGLTAAHALSIEPRATRLALAGLLALSVFLVGTATALSRRGARTLANLIVVLGAFVAFAGIIQKASGTDRIYGFWQPEHHPYQIFGPFVNRNHFAAWMVMALSVGVGLLCGNVADAMRQRRLDRRSFILWLASAQGTQLLLVTFATVVMGIALLMTLSRSGIVSFGAMLVAVSWFIARWQWQGSGRRLAAGSYLLVVALVTVGWAGVDPVLNRFATGDSLRGRLGAWRAAGRIARDFPLTGTGLNTYGTASQFYDPAAPTLHWDAAHNDYLQLLSESGLLVGVPIVLFALAMAYEIRGRLREADPDVVTAWIRVGAVAGLLAIALQETVDFSLQIPGNAALFAVLCAIAIHAQPARAGQPSLSSPPGSSSSSIA